MRCATCGYLVHETDSFIVVALNRTDRSDDGRLKTNVGETIQIPRSAITSIRELRASHASRKPREAAQKRRR